MCIILGFFIFLLTVLVGNKLWCFWCRSNVCLVGKTSLVVGGVSGLGYRIALSLAARGSRVIIADVVDTSHAVKDIIKESHNPNVVGITEHWKSEKQLTQIGIGQFRLASYFCRNEGEHGGSAIYIKKSVNLTVNNNNKPDGSASRKGKSVDFTSFKSVREFAKNLYETEDALHILMCNAGIAEISQDKITEDGLQKTMQVNYFSHFLMVYLLLDLLKKSAPSRVVFTSSLAAYMSSLTRTTVAEDFKKGDNTHMLRFGSYADSKLVLTAAARMFGEKLAGTGVTVNAALLNGVKTEIFQHAAKHEINRMRTLWGIMVSCFGKTTEEGAQLLINLAVDNSLKNVTSRSFYEGMRIPNCLQPFQISEEFCDKLWNLSVKCTKLEKEDMK